jgi:hypothetical protein
MTKNPLPTQSKPPNKRIVGFDEFLVAQPQDCDVDRAGVKGLAETLLALPQQMLRVRATRLFQGEGNRRRQRGNKINFLRQPVARRANVLVAEDANNLASNPNGGIEHGRDAQRFPIALRQTARG